MKLKSFCLALFVSFLVQFPITTYSADVISPQNTGITWYDAKSLGIEGKGWQNTADLYDRLPAHAEATVRPPVWALSHDTAGLYVRFDTDASTIKIRWTLAKEKLALKHMPSTGVSGVDIYAKDAAGIFRFISNGQPNGVINEKTVSLPPSDAYILYFPLYNGLKHVELGIPDKNSLSSFPALPSADNIVFYGTSITQGGTVSRPGMAATSIVSRALGKPVINLGFSGNGKMEPELSELLSELDPAIYVLDALWNMNPQMVTERFEPFIIKLRQTHPTTPILLAEDSNFQNRPTEKGDIARAVFQKLKAAGDENLYFLNNTGMLGDDHEGTVDRVHPTDLGMAIQAKIFIKKLNEIMKY